VTETVEQLLPLPGDVFALSREALVDEMLKRLSAHDYVAALLLAELVALDAPDHALASLCMKEALAALQPLLESPLKLGTTTWQPDVGSREAALLARVDDTTTADALLRSSTERLLTLRALHELLRVGAVHAARSVTVVERANTMPAPGR
jgi:hypothetical protein